MIDVLTDWKTLIPFRDEWNRLARKSGKPTCDFDWFAACNTAIGAPGDLRIVLVREADRVRAIAPLILDHGTGGARLRMLDHFTSEPGDFPHDDDAALVQLGDAILRLGYPIEIYRLPTHVVEIVAATGRPPGMLSTPEDPKSTARVWTADGWTAVEQEMSTSSKSHIRRKRRKAEKSGALSLEVTSPDLDEVDEQLAEVFRVESAGWKQRAGSSILSRPRSVTFLTTYGRLAAKEGRLRLFFLRLGEDTVAVRMAAAYANRIWELKIGFDERWASCSPGILLADESLRYASEQGIEAFEFMGSHAAWQDRWPLEHSRYSQLRFYPYTLAGAVSGMTDLAKKAVHAADRLAVRYQRGGTQRTDKDRAFGSFSRRLKRIVKR